MGILSWLFGRRAPVPSTLVADIKNGPGLFGIDVVGESHYQNNLGMIGGKKDENSKRVSVEATLVLDDGNKFDKNAVAVFINGLQVGHLDRETAKSFREQLGRVGAGRKITTARCPAIIVGGWCRGEADEGFYGVKLDLPLG